MMFIFGGLAVFIGGIMLMSEEGNNAIATDLLASFFVFLFFGAICWGLSTIARTALYQRIIMESQYEFWDVEKKGNIPEEKTGSENKNE
jgi:hypothetical protein